ncbi:MAG: hypothetical protein L3J82_01030, partial [Planctomycetes bacterium]|nr:hypothetical protein [Planctomycetota bacterium]
MNELQKKYGDNVAFLFLYTEEAHPSDGTDTPKEAFEKYEGRPGGWKSRGANKIKDHTKYSERVAAAKTRRKAGKIEWRVIVDDMKETIQKTWGNLPNHAFLINPQGKIEHKWAWVAASTGGRRPMQQLDKDTSKLADVLDKQESLKAMTVAQDSDLYLRDVADGEWIKYDNSSAEFSPGEEGTVTITRTLDPKDGKGGMAMSSSREFAEIGKKALESEQKTMKVGEIVLPCTVVNENNAE